MGLLGNETDAGGAKGDRGPRAPSAAELHGMMAIGYWEWDVRTEAFLWSDGMYALYGFSPGAFTPTKHSLLDFVAPQDLQSVLDTWGRGNESPPAGAIECRITRADGALRHVRYAWHTVGGDGENLKVYGMAQDITALRSVLDVPADDTHLRGMVECSADYIWEFCADIVTGPEAGAAAGPADTLILKALGAEEPGAGRPVIDRTGDHDFAPLEEAFGAREKFRDILVPIIDGRREPRWVSLSGHPQFDAAGAYYGYRGVGADVTDRMRARDLEEDRRRAGAVGRLASGLAHEINNLLQPILIYSAFGAEEAKQHEKLRLYFTRITRAAERASLIVKNVLSFARHTPSQDDINVPAVVRETIDLMSGTVGGRARIELAVTEDTVIARAERTGLAQIVTNLIANAADALGADSRAADAMDGRIVVHVEHAVVSGEGSKAAGVAPGSYCRISVEDTGPGIAPDLLAKVFDPFFTTKPQGKGTGLGLAVVSGIAKSWGGGVTVESVFGQGSRFTVYLPAPERGLQAAQ